MWVPLFVKPCVRCWGAITQSPKSSVTTTHSPWFCDHDRLRARTWDRDATTRAGTSAVEATTCRVMRSRWCWLRRDGNHSAPARPSPADNIHTPVSTATIAQHITCGLSTGLTKSIYYLRQRRRYMFFARVCLSVCLSVSNITQKRVHGFGWNVARRQMSGHGRND